MPPGKAWTRLLATLASLAATSAAHGADLRLQPVSLSLGPAEDSATLWLDNAGDTPLLAQVRVFSWNQQGGGEVLAATADLAASPPSLEVPPHGRQRVRVVRLRPGTPAVEAAYRLIVDELPGAGQPASSATSRRRYSIPAFLLPATAATAPRLGAGIGEDAGGRRVLRLTNGGDRHARVAGLAVVDRDGHRHVLAAGLAGYVLARRHKDWPLPDDIGQPPYGRLEARVNGEAVILATGLPLPAGR